MSCWAESRGPWAENPCAGEMMPWNLGEGPEKIRVTRGICAHNIPSTVKGGWRGSLRCTAGRCLGFSWEKLEV